jgi:hypothetical protein
VLHLPVTGYYRWNFVLALAFLGAYVRATGVAVGALRPTNQRVDLAT